MNQNTNRVRSVLLGEDRLWGRGAVRDKANEFLFPDQEPLTADEVDACLLDLAMAGLLRTNAGRVRLDLDALARSMLQ